MASATILVSVRPVPAPEASGKVSAAVQAEYEAAAGSLLCYCGCARQTVKDCTCGVAFELRDQFEGQLAKGATSESIIAAYIDEHGEQSRNVPEKKGLSLLAWFGPAVAIVLAAVATLTVLLVWSARGRRSAHGAPMKEESEQEASLRKRMEKELREFDS